MTSTITGTVKNSGNQPVVGASVIFQPVNSAKVGSNSVTSLAASTTVTDGSGNFSVTLESGKYTVISGIDRLPISIPDDGLTHAINNVLES